MYPTGRSSLTKIFRDENQVSAVSGSVHIHLPRCVNGGTVRALVAIAFALSVTLTVMEAALPDIVGVPEMAPPELNDNPAGNVPAVNTQVYGAVPPVTARVCE
jgi:hypothetical protein